MPRVKIDYIVSFSSEDESNQANNLLSWDISPKKKWLCKKGEPSCSVVLQLARAVKICAVDLGAYHSALVEVLVGRAESPGEPFQVLVPRSVFLAPADSRKGLQVERVRSFRGPQLCEEATKGSRVWDRVRVVCSQPYNKHCNYGLSFVHIFEPEDEYPAWKPPSATPKQLLNFNLPSSDEEEFKPGELFAKLGHKTPTKTYNTESQIRQATTNAESGSRDSRTGLVKTSIGRTGLVKTSIGRTEAGTPPPAEKANTLPPAEKATGARQQSKAETPPPAEKATAVRQQSEDKVMRGVVFALSGYENPRRAALREKGVRMGARYEPQWTERCTHLVCAFSGTPKMRALRAAGSRCVPVRGHWLDECWRRRRLLPATDFPPGPVSPPPVADEGQDSDRDTDDEIDGVLRAQTTSDNDAYALSTDTEPDRDQDGGEGGGGGWLPNFFDGLSFVIGEDVAREGYDERQLLRYICAYGGTVLPPHSGEEGDRVVIRARGPRNPEWLWRCHEAQKLLP